MSKVCTKCLNSLSEDNFSYKNRAKGRLSAVCKKCHSLYRKQHYDANKQKYRDKANHWRNQMILKYREYKKTVKCTDCGLQDFRVIDFDHLDSNIKIGCVSHLFNSKSYETVMLEIAKCEPVCANCHRIRTFNRRKCNWEVV